MLTFMQSTYQKRKPNVMILFGSAALFAVPLWLVRSQSTVGDISYMRANDSASLDRDRDELARAHLQDPHGRALAKDIIDPRQREIEEMKRLIAGLDRPQ